MGPISFTWVVCLISYSPPMGISLRFSHFYNLLFLVPEGGKSMQNHKTLSFWKTKRCFMRYTCHSF